MKKQSSNITFPENLLKELSGGPDYDKALEQFKTFRDDLLSPREYTDLLKKLHETLLDLQTESLETIKTLEKSIKKYSQDLN